MARMFQALACLMLCCAPVLAAPKPVALSNSATGITLPAGFTKTVADQYVDVSADCKGPVTWLITSATVVPKYTDRGNNTVTVGIPNTAAVISVYAVGLVDGKLTTFVRTDITVLAADPNAQPQPPPAPGPTPVTPTPVTPTPAPVAASPPYHVSIVEDPTQQRAPALAQILDSPTITTTLAPPNYKLYDLDISSDLVKAKGLAAKIDAAKKSRPDWATVPAWLVVQRSNGVVTLVVPVPATEAALVQAVQNAR
jgi:hypothetical protein